MATKAITSLALGTTNLGVGQTSSVRSFLYPEISIADFVTAGGVTTNRALIMNIPAHSRLNILEVQVVDADLSLGAGARIDIGDNSADTTWVSNATTLTNGTVLTVAGSATTYTTADTLFIKITGGTIASQGTIRLVIEVVDCNRRAPAKAKVYTNSGGTLPVTTAP